MLFDTADYEGALRNWIGAAAQVLAALTTTLLLVALIGEIFRSLDRLPRFVSFTDSVTPLAARRVVASLVAGGIALIGAVAPAGAAETQNARHGQVPATSTTLSVRQWLEQQTRTTTTPGMSAAPSEPRFSNTPSTTPSSPPTLREGSGLTYGTTTSNGGAGTGADVAANRSGEADQPGARTAVEPGTRALREPEVAPPGTRYVVRAGDSLWKIANKELGGGASSRSIIATWHQIYEANREAVGEDPGLIHPGLVLQLPPIQP